MKSISKKALAIILSVLLIMAVIPMAISAEIDGYTLQKITDYETLRVNSSSNSSQQANKQEADLKTKNEQQNGSPSVAFDEDCTNLRWIQKFDNNGTGSGNTSVPSESNPIWVQTGFGGTKLIGAVGYVRDDAAPNTTILNYKVSVANSADFSDEQVVKTGTFENKSGEQMVEFETPVEAAYVRLTATSIVGGISAGAREIHIYEAIPDAPAVVTEDITDSIVFSASSVDSDAGNHGIENLTDDNEESIWAASGSETESAAVMLKMPYNLKSVTGIEIKFENNDDTANRSQSVKLETSPLGHDDVYTVADEQADVNMHDTYSYSFTESDPAGVSGIKTLKITLSERKQTGMDSPLFYFNIAEIKVTGILDVTTAKALYGSHKIEWTVEEESANTAGYKIMQQPTGTEDWTDVTSSGTVTAASVGSKQYYTFILPGVETGTGAGYSYKVVTADNETQVGDIAVVADNTGIDAMQKNALVSLNYGVDGKTFAGTDASQIVTAVPATDAVTVAKLQAVHNGATIATTFEALGSGNRTIASFANSGAFVSVQDSNSGQLRLELAGGFKFSTSTVTGLNDGRLTSFAFAITPTTWHFYANGGSGYLGTSTVDYTSIFSTLTEVVIGGTDVGADLFTGTLYTFIISEEYFNHGSDLCPLADVSQIKASIVLKNKLDEMEGSEGTDGTYNQYVAENYYTAESLESLKTAIDNGNSVIAQYSAGSASESDCQTAYQAIVDAESALEFDGFVIHAGAGTGAGKIELTMDGQDVSSDSTSAEVEILARDFENLENKEVTVTATPSWSELEFAGWFNADGEPIVDENGEAIKDAVYTFTVESPEDITLIAEYTGHNGVPSESSVEEITDTTTLMKYAKANSEQYPVANNDGDATYAFNGEDGNWWHSRYNTGTETRTENVINGEPCEESASNAATEPTREDPTWIQTGFDEVKVLGGFLYNNRTASPGNNIVGDYEIWVSNNEDMSDYTVAYSGTMYDANNSIDNRNKLIAFDAPYEAQFVRMVIYSKAGGGSAAHITASKIGIYEYVGEEQTGEVELKLNGETVGSLAVGQNKHVQLAKDLAEESVTAEQFSEFIANNDIADIFGGSIDTIKEHYTIAEDAFNAEDGTCTITSAPATYTVTANINGGDVTATAEYGKPLYIGETEEYITAPESETGKFAYWQNAAGEAISTSAVYNYVATDTMTITAVYDSTVGYGAYIPAPVVSKTMDNKWRVEIPVTLLNAMVNVTDENGEVTGHKLRDEVKDFGVIVAGTDVSEDDIKAAITAGGTNDAEVLSAYAGAGEKKVTPTNKGRYLHTITSENIINTKVAAYIVVSGEDGDTVYISTVKTIAE